MLVNVSNSNLHNCVSRTQRGKFPTRGKTGFQYYIPHVDQRFDILSEVGLYYSLVDLGIQCSSGQRDLIQLGVLRKLVRC